MTVEYHRSRHQRRLLRPVRRRASTPTRTRCSARLREEAPLYYNDAARLLRAEPVRRRQQGAGRPRDVQLGPRRDHRTDQGQHRDPARHSHFRGSADPRHPPQAAGPDVHAAQDQRAGAEDPRVLRAGAWTRWSAPAVRLRRRPRRADADAGDQHAAGHPRGRPGDRSATTPTRRCAPRPASR